MTCWMLCMRSVTPSSDTRALPLTASVTPLIQGGRKRRTACGAITDPRRCEKVRPMALAASICPWGMEPIAPRTFSTTCAVLKTVRATTAVLEHLSRIWREPDEGIWEVRGPSQHFTHEGHGLDRI